MEDAVLMIQWIRNDGITDTDIPGTWMDETYEVVSADEGNTLKVRVSFWDDAMSSESLTSAATATVAGQTNSLATGVPTITGTAQVGETLTADTASITDADGLANVSYSYQWVSNDGILRHRHHGCDGLYLHPGSRRRGQDHQSEGHLHRRCRVRRDADQYGDGDG